MSNHRFPVGAEVRIVKDLSGKEPEVVGCDAAVLNLLPAEGKYPQYKVAIYGEKKAHGGVFIVDEREIGLRVK